MNTFSLRFRVDLAPGCLLSSETPELRLLETPEGQEVVLIGVRDEPLSKSSRLVLKAREWTTGEAAEDAGKWLGDVFLLAFVRNRIGVESWMRRAGGGYFPGGLRMLEEKMGQRVLNDSPGLTVYETHPGGVFASPKGTGTRMASAVAFAESFRSLAGVDLTLTERERTAIDLFNASFFEPAADTRLITLVMATEALLELLPRPPGAVSLVDSFISQVGSSSLTEWEQASLVGSLRWLRKESIRSAGRRLSQQRLGEALYAGDSAPDFFGRCYELRSVLVHGGDMRRAREAAATVVGNLEIFVADLLTGRFVRPGPTAASSQRVS